MNLHEILAMPRSERDRVERSIKTLERLEQQPNSGRGRRSMGAADRKAVSERMRRHWEAWGNASAKTLRSCAGFADARLLPDVLPAFGEPSLVPARQLRPGLLLRTSGSIVLRGKHVACFDWLFRPAPKGRPETQKSLLTAAPREGNLNVIDTPRFARLGGAMANPSHRQLLVRGIQSDRAWKC